jgi:hypothetical protein
MPQSKILIDSNAYFRLAQSIRPLLKEIFGDENYCLYVIKELQEEFEKNPRLKNSFPWVNSPEFVENRTHRLQISRPEKKEIERTYNFILDFVRDEHPDVSRVDVLCLAHAEVLKIPVVTDDAEMLEVAAAFEIKTFKTLELLKLMLDCGHIDMAKVREIASYWQYQNDKPKDFKKDYKRIFAEEPPK